MNYIPGTAKPIIGGALMRKTNCYEVFIKCDANDGDYMRDSFVTKTLTEIECLLINYLRRYEGKWSKGNRWGRHYGHKVNEIPLGDYLVENNWLLFAGMCDSVCHSISSINVIYYDEQGIPHDVSFPDVDDLFDSEEEFLSYIYKLIGYNEETEEWEELEE